MPNFVTTYPLIFLESVEMTERYLFGNEKGDMGRWSNSSFHFPFRDARQIET